MSEPANEYEISTIRDIYEKIPFDRVDTCMKELSILIRQAQATKALVDEVAKATIGQPMDAVRFPEMIVWKDDGAGKLTVNVTLNGENLLTVETESVKEGQE